MRLDHLLSKEHLEVFGSSRHAGSDRTCLPAAHGWNIDIGSRLNGSDLVRLACGVGTVGAGMAGTCTLLGPEGPDNPARVGGGDGFFRPSPMMTVGRRVWGFWPSVENYIVDASILDSGLRSWITKVSRRVASFGVLFGVFTGQFRIRAFGFGCTNSIELM